MTEQPQSPTLAQQRVMRVFVSSTFRDMHAEREELVKRIFPQLRELCEARGVTWGEVDLRWGITDEQQAEGQVLPICLAEIQRCLPYFIGLLGERYGWIPDEIAPQLMAQEPWLAEHREHSVTEMEILHGVLNNPTMANHAFFYLRDPAYIASLSPEKQGAFREEPTAEEIEQYGLDAAIRRAEQRQQKLGSLKVRIRTSGLPVREPYRDPRELGEWVLRDMTAVIDRLYPEAETPDPLDREAAEHEAFARSRTVVTVGPDRYAGVYIGRQEYFDRLDAHAAGDDPPLVILGASGSGKSALLANWALRYREAHPGELVLMHFIGASPYSADGSAMLRRLIGAFRRTLHIEQDIPDQPEALRLAFANALHMAAACGRVVLVLDALNQLEDRDQAPDLVWLPPVIPANVRLLVSTLPGRPQDDLKKRGWPVLTVEPLSPDERQALIEQYLAQYTKALSPDRSLSIARATQTANPLYLRALLEELRLFGEHKRLDERIAYYLAAETIPELYERILQRYEEDYERDRPGLVRDAMTRLWAARRGLSEAELLDLLGADGAPLPRAHWSPLYLAAEQSLVSRSGRIGFFHDYLREAVRRRYLLAQETQNAAHLQLAEYFAAQPPGPRQVDELPWQLAEAKAWQRLYDLLADLPFFYTAWTANQFEVKGYWAKIEENSSLRMVDAYRPVLENPGRMSYVNHVATLLRDTAYPGEASALRADLIEYYRQIGNKQGLQVSLGHQALILRDWGRQDEAMALLKDKERLCRELGNKDGLQVSLSHQALILHDWGRLEEAMGLHKDQERLCRELGNKHGLQASLGNQAIILHDWGRLEEALALFKDQERLCRELGNKHGLQVPLAGQAAILWTWGRLEEALALFKDQERLCRELGHKYGLSISLGNQALILWTWGRLEEALALFKDQERLCRELGHKYGLSISLGNQALILHDWGRLEEAMGLHKDQERLCRELGNKDGLQVSLGNQARILRAWGRLEEAMGLHKDQERLCRELGNKDGLQVSLGNQARILCDWGRLEEAMGLHKEKERLCRELGNKDGLQVSLGDQARILRAWGRLEEAMGLHKDQERLCRELGNKDGLQVSLGDQARILRAWGRLDEALTLHKDQERLCRELGDKQRLSLSLANQAILLVEKMSQPKEAWPLVEEAYRLAMDHGPAALAEQIKRLIKTVRLLCPDRGSFSPGDGKPEAM